MIKIASLPRTVWPIITGWHDFVEEPTLLIRLSTSIFSVKEYACFLILLAVSIILSTYSLSFLMKKSTLISFRATIFAAKEVARCSAALFLM